MGINKSVIILFCLLFLACNKTQELEEKITSYIEKHSNNNISENQYYVLLNTNSCYPCNEVIVKYLNELESVNAFNLILKGNSKKEIQGYFPLDENLNFKVNFDLSKSKTNFKMPILIISKANSLEIYEININNYSAVLSKIE